VASNCKYCSNRIDCCLNLNQEQCVVGQFGSKAQGTHSDHPKPRRGRVFAAFIQPFKRGSPESVLWDIVRKSVFAFGVILN